MTTGAAQTLGEFASRLTGSSDLYEDDGRQPSASVNIVTSHDGFTLNDLVAYDQKRRFRGLGVLVGGRERARSGDGELVLVATGRNVVKVLELTGLTRVFEIHPSRAAAVSGARSTTSTRGRKYGA